VLPVLLLLPLSINYVIIESIPNKKTDILSREFLPNIAIIIVSGQKLIFQSAL
jgi:hypothetical protein